MTGCCARRSPALAGRDDDVTATVRAFCRTYQAHVADVIRARNPELPEHLYIAHARVFTALIEGVALFRTGIADHTDTTTDQILVTTAAALLDPDPPAADPPPRA